jgi:hypothetical protein
VAASSSLGLTVISSFCGGVDDIAKLEREGTGKVEDKSVLDILKSTETTVIVHVATEHLITKPSSSL